VLPRLSTVLIENKSISQSSFPSCERILPRSLLYSIAAGIGGSGLDAVAFETLQIAYGRGFLGQAVALSNNQNVVPAAKIAELRFHPVKALSFLPRHYYVGAKKHALDAFTASRLLRGDYDLVHTWSGDSVKTLHEANRRKVPAILEIPTWHRNKGKVKPAVTKSERERDAAPFPQSAVNSLLVTRQQVMEEYERADLIFVLSEKARETFRIAGLPDEKLFMMHRGVDAQKFTPASTPPEKFRAIFVGSLIKRKGVHLLLEAWRKLSLPDAELVLVGGVQGEIEPFLKEFGGEDVKVLGFCKDVASELKKSSVHIFPSELEGSAKATYEAAACGLPQITTREAGDIVIHGQTGRIIPPNDLEALTEAIRWGYSHRDVLVQMGAAARQRIVENFTWDHFREKLLDAYDLVLRRQ